jgi:hypothetical protein
MVATVMGVAIVLVAGAGIADASNGDPLLVGKSNKASGTTKLKSTSIPLALAGPKSKPPLAVNSKKMVPHLNAQFLGGQSAGQLSQSTRQIVGPMSGGLGIVHCPAGTHPVGGGVLPDLRAPDDDGAFVVASFPHINNNNVFDGWEGAAKDLDSTYTGGGFVFAYCTTGSVPVSQGVARAARVQQREMLAKRIMG